MILSRFFHVVYVDNLIKCLQIEFSRFVKLINEGKKIIGGLPIVK